MSQKLEKSPGQEFLARLAGFPADSFERRFCINSSRLGLGAKLDRNELTLLYEAALRADLCQLAFNGCELPGRGISAQNEPRRSQLEREFMNARDVLHASPGWQNLSCEEQDLIEQIFLSVTVAEGNLAW